MVPLDQATAFDMVDHRYLVAVPAQFCLCLSFLRRIIQMYVNIDSLVRAISFLPKPICIKYGLQRMSTRAMFARDGS